MKNSNSVLQTQKSSTKPTPAFQTMLLKLTILLLSVLFAFPGNGQNTLKRGVYKTFEEFKNNTPNTEDQFYVDKKERKRKNWKGTYSVTPRFEEGGKKIKYIWGFCDGEQAYVFHQKEFFPIEKTENSQLFFGYGVKKGSVKGGGVALAAGDVMMSAPILGVFAAVPLLLTGGIIAASTASSYKKQKMEYLIDPINGKIY